MLLHSLRLIVRNPNEADGSFAPYDEDGFIKGVQVFKPLLPAIHKCLWCDLCWIPFTFEEWHHTWGNNGPITIPRHCNKHLFYALLKTSLVICTVHSCTLILDAFLRPQHTWGLMDSKWTSARHICPKVNVCGCTCMKNCVYINQFCIWADQAESWHNKL